MALTDGRIRQVAEINSQQDFALWGRAKFDFENLNEGSYAVAFAYKFDDIWSNHSREGGLWSGLNQYPSQLDLVLSIGERLVAQTSLLTEERRRLLDCRQNLFLFVPETSESTRLGCKPGFVYVCVGVKAENRTTAPNADEFVDNCGMEVLKAGLYHGMFPEWVSANYAFQGKRIGLSNSRIDNPDLEALCPELREEVRQERASKSSVPKS
ncbi:hypothetical protein HN592_03680 [Candidatus Woesearchaeota archaeon]|jgi:hypothetical protein|nr:hypothetical protein [Candidatus Woesearchaeota archaeon]MBT4368313.1 hypothetical protein [Candidatus Woesearchaeota archaeon]MBT4712802.1 hypothetical protein [Candidatus Woesearchaeota archaeon]MBT6639714.1 hypothetical protein [Candidatus Woesearchaeota archaeon]MBT7133886.1 hypothetical protein [Candidatus Woesearchaeota archaeon]